MGAPRCRAHRSAPRPVVPFARRCRAGARPSAPSRPGAPGARCRRRCRRHRCAVRGPLGRRGGRAASCGRRWRDHSRAGCRPRRGLSAALEAGSLLGGDVLLRRGVVLGRRSPVPPRTPAARARRVPGAGCAVDRGASRRRCLGDRCQWPAARLLSVAQLAVHVDRVRSNDRAEGRVRYRVPPQAGAPHGHARDPGAAAEGPVHRLRHQARG